MLPPVDDAILQNNPKFAALYATLTNVILSPDGSTKTDPAAKERDAVRGKLDKHRLKSAKQHLLIHAISTANPTQPEARLTLPASAVNRRAKPQPPSSRQDRGASSSTSELPAPLLDLLLLLPPLLTATPSTLSPESATLLLTSPPLSEFPTHLPQLASLVSSNLHTSAVHLARIANPNTNPSFIHRSLPSLPAYATSLTASLAERKAALTKARLSAATELTSLLQSQSVVLAHLLRALEAKHGPIARSLEFRAREVALAAQKQETEAETALWAARRDTYTPDVVRALTNYAGHLRDAKSRMGEAIRFHQAELEAYGVAVDDQQHEKGAKERTMREMARVYRDMGRQVEEVRGDLERLGRA
ncbi:hypothetical protein B0H63DRAFT_391371 [Podospora didyma]|uniref:HAUS augmin-like complex subunit 4 n=1 Tax=Podospora didyma TaxID=330526 RepID=A0AAE0NSK9_9PEZI|nr:hypothetical protein B0H63DRAFT_391371 [Podospora didyma]